VRELVSGGDEKFMFVQDTIEKVVGISLDSGVDSERDDHFVHGRHFQVRFYLLVFERLVDEDLAVL